MQAFDSDTDTDSGSSSDDSEYDDENGSPRTGKVMSIFASYYGIEDENEGENRDEEQNSNIDMIDSPNFDATVFVKDLLLEKSATELIAEDTKMVHEIRSLDSDMQMLVYENYNKFISATETIKRMKNNVEAMETDIDDVKKKTLQISQSVVKVEETLHGKRAEVDKLVKIRKLLQKLEFLSELPEKLDAMISAEQYTQAVELYNQTITVLAKHSNVLSFRNIHARTVEMMKDLRIKVLGLLDDTNSKSLDVVKLTEYVTTLRLMEAPSVDVIRMFLLAHKNRWNLVTTMYKTKLFELKSRHTGENSTISCEDAPELLLEMRKYHQNVVSGLMEACKGIYEMYHDKKGSTHTDDRTEAIQAHDDLQTMVRETMCAYTNVIVESVQLFVKSYNSFMREDGLNVVSTCIENKLTTVENSEIQTALQAYRDCRSDWMEQNASYAFLCRQLVLDVQYLDESVEEARCFPHELTSSLKTEHSDIVSRVLLELVVDPQMATAFHRHVDTYTTVVASSIPHFVQNCNLKREVAAESVAIMSCSLSHLATGNVGAAMEAMDAALKFEERNQLTQHRRVVIPDRTKSALHWRKALTNTYFSIFKSLAVELKSYYELVSVMNEEVTLDVPTVCYPKTAPASIDVSCSGIDDQGGAVNLTHIMSSYVSQIPRKTSNVCDVRYSEYYRDVFNITEASKAGAVVVLENGVSAMQCRFGYQLRSLGSMLKMYCESTVLRLELLAGLSARTLETQISTATGMGVNSDNSRLGGDWNCLVFDEEAEHAVVVYDKDTGLQSQVNEEQGDLDEYYKNMSQKLSKKSRQALGLDPDGSEAEDGLSVDDSTVSKICSGCNFTALVIHFLLSSLCSADDAVATESRSSHSSRPSRVIHEVSIDQFEAFLATIQDLEYPEAIIELLETDSGHLDAHCGSCMSLSSRRLLVHHNESCVAYMNQLLTHMPVYEYTRDTRDNDCCALHFIVSTIDCYNKEGVGLENPIGGSRLCDDSSRIEAFHRGESTVSDTLLDMMMILDVISCSVCILLGDAPPAMKSAPGMDRNNDQESDYSSRYYQSSNVSASTVGRRSSMQNTQSSIGLQLDIERLFSEKILIGNYSDIVEKPDNFGIMSCIVKSTLKSLCEQIRLLHFYQYGKENQLDASKILNTNHNSYMLMQMVTDLMFLKQALVYVLKETNETDRLIDQCMTALTSRCCIVNTDPDASNSSKTSYMSDNDMSMVHLIEDCTSNKHMSRTISDGLLILNRVCVLFQR